MALGEKFHSLKPYQTQLKSRVQDESYVASSSGPIQPNPPQAQKVGLVWRPHLPGTFDSFPDQCLKAGWEFGRTDLNR